MFIKFQGVCVGIIKEIHCGRSKQTVRHMTGTAEKKWNGMQVVNMHSAAFIGIPHSLSLTGKCIITCF